MIAAAKHTLHFARLLIVTAVLLSVPFVANMQPAAAQPMQEHTMAGNTQSDCATYCATRINSSAQLTLPNHEEVRTPDPVPVEYEPYYSQFQPHYTPRTLHSYVYGSYSIRPPDIVKLSANFRF